MICSIEAILGYVSLERVVGVSPWCITAWLTYLGQHQCQALYILFFLFLWYKNIYVLCFQIYMYYKMNIGGLWLRPGPTMSEKVFNQLMSFKRDESIDLFLRDLIMLHCLYLYCRHLILFGLFCFIRISNVDCRFALIIFVPYLLLNVMLCRIVSCSSYFIYVKCHVVLFNYVL